MRLNFTALILVACLLAGCATPAQRATRERLADIVIPEVDLRQACITDVAAFLADAARPEPSAPERVAVSVAHTLARPSDGPPPEFDFSASPTNDPIPLITIIGKDIPFFALVEIVCSQTGLEYMIDRNGNLILRRKGPTTPSTATK
ncbi:MAG: hypothetical protein KJ579_11420 [Verrucomicrobia bacterium]|nr:hypothetical protein [Verrucomicrobiota bacterium]